MDMVVILSHSPDHSDQLAQNLLMELLQKETEGCPTSESDEHSEVESDSCEVLPPTKKAKVKTAIIDRLY